MVKITNDFTYTLDEVRSRTLPAGWKGPVPSDIARKIKADRCGDIDDAAEAAAEARAIVDKEAADAAEKERAKDRRGDKDKAEAKAKADADAKAKADAETSGSGPAKQLDV
ncbi:hypothetical protein [uncultured Sulfitobacter sp.]|uniref:hypothetical protein n=1 Tax=uncultured Sulfitobacter sp. TaxID=191468 RepID=UPI0026296046|nr:hypothetical protein [uncultured Sulfitobacter sp.]